MRPAASGTAEGDLEPSADDRWWLDDDHAGEDAITPRGGSGRLSNGTALFALAPLAAVVGILLVVLGSMVLARRPYESVDGAPRVSYAEAAKTLRFTRAGTYLAYVETDDAASAPPAGQLRIVAVDDAGRLGELRRFTRTVDYDANGRHGYARWSVRIEHAGAFQVQVHNSGLPTGSAMTFGRVSGVGLFAGVALVLPGALLLTVAVGFAALGALLRRRSRREIDAALLRAGASSWQ